MRNGCLCLDHVRYLTLDWEFPVGGRGLVKPGTSVFIWGTPLAHPRDQPDKCARKPLQKHDYSLQVSIHV